MMWLIENWVLLVCGIGVICAGIGVAWKFFKLPSTAQIAKVKEWLLWACLQAEKELGSGTGGIKLRQVYDLFVQRFPAVAMAVSFDTFGLWVEGALEEMRRMLTENQAVRKVVSGSFVVTESLTKGRKPQEDERVFCGYGEPDQGA